MTVRIGNGFDVHRFGERYAGEKGSIRLGGVDVPHERPLVAHSDGDVIIHALCDAMLGALALGDIGSHFPDGDPALAGADSRVLLQRVADMTGERGWSLVNADLCVLAQAPKLAPHVPAMREALAGILRVDAACVSIKATTTEGLGFVGRREGIAAYAVVLLGRADHDSGT